MTSLYVAAVLAIVVLLASMFSVELGLSVAIIEIIAGAVVGNTLQLATPDWLTFLAGFGSVVLTFLAGAEVDPSHMRATLKASLIIGFGSFLLPFVGVVLACRYGFGWDWKAAQIGGIALSTTSLAVVYAVLVETGLNATRVGKLLIGACFVTDMGTALALSAIFITPNGWFPAFLVGSVVLILLLPKIAPSFFRRYGDRVIEPEIKLVFACLLVLMVLADASKGQAVLPAFVLGLVMSRHYQAHREEQMRLRVVAFAFLTPFFFLKGGLNVSLEAVFANLGLLAVLFAAKMVPKLGLVFPLARRAEPRHAPFITLLMSTGLTFGTISALYGLNAGIIDRTQFSLLVTVVVLSAIIPTAIAQWRYSPLGDLDRHTHPVPVEEYI
jgi:Kef-type K+ transport system membrane component KefB